MARFDVYQLRGVPGYLVDVQADFLKNLDTRVVVPLLPEGEVRLPAKRLNPRFIVGDVSVVMMTEFLAAISKASLQSPVDNLGDHRDEIAAAIDFLFQGF